MVTNPLLLITIVVSNSLNDLRSIFFNFPFFSCILLSHTLYMEPSHMFHPEPGKLFAPDYYYAFSKHKL